MFSVPRNEIDPIAVYKLGLCRKSAAEMNSDDSLFYLAVNSLKKLESYSNSIMKNMSEKTGLAIKFTSHSGRKTMTQTLVSFGKPNFPPTDIIQLSGHKNQQSVTQYSTVNDSQQMEMSRTLSSVANANLNHLCNLTTRNSRVSVHSSTKI